MPYSVLQKSPEPVSVEQLRRAYQGTPGFAGADALTLGRDAIGVLAKNLEWEAAAALQSALAAQGVPAEVLDEATLPQLPPTRRVHRLDCQPEALMIYDPLGRSFPLEWKNILMIAAGKVKMSDFTTVMVPHVKVVGRGELVMVPEPETRENRNEHLILEIIISRAALRYTVFPDKPPGGFSFQYLGARQTRGVAANFSLLVRDLLQFAPGAAVNCGAACLRDIPERKFVYPSKTAFYQEIVWMLWQMTLANDPERAGS